MGVWSQPNRYQRRQASHENWGPSPHGQNHPVGTGHELADSGTRDTPLVVSIAQCARTLMHCPEITDI